MAKKWGFSLQSVQTGSGTHRVTQPMGTANVKLTNHLHLLKDENVWRSNPTFMHEVAIS